MTFLAPILLAFAVTSYATGSIAGCIVDPMRQPLPGVTVVATGESLRDTTETDAAGCYSLKRVHPGAYRVTARLAGFANVTRDKIVVRSDAATTLDMTMSVSPICECVLIDGTLQELINGADAVLHLRVMGPLEGQPSQSPYSYVHAAAVLHVLKSTEPGAKVIALLQNQKGGSAAPYDVDQEMVVFLQRGRDGLSIINDDPGLIVDGKKAALAFLVRDGEIVDAPSRFSSDVGRTLDSFMYELRVFAGGR
jgi:Carboxypeptidase regulatory-like domain